MKVLLRFLGDARHPGVPHILDGLTPPGGLLPGHHLEITTELARVLGHHDPLACACQVAHAANANLSLPLYAVEVLHDIVRETETAADHIETIAEAAPQRVRPPRKSAATAAQE